MVYDPNNMNDPYNTDTSQGWGWDPKTGLKKGPQLDPMTGLPIDPNQNLGSLNSQPTPGGTPSTPGGTQASPGGISSITPPAPQQPATSSLGQPTFGPNSNLIGTQINPDLSPDTQAARNQLGTQLGALQGPDRMGIAQQAYNDLQTGLGNQEKLGIQDIGREAAAAGRLGSGMVSTSLGDLQTQLAQQQNLARSALAQNVAGQTLSDKLAALQGTQSGLGSLAGLDQASQNALRGERGYQSGLDQQNIQNQLQQYQAQQGAQNQAFNQNQAQLGSLLSLAGGGDQGYLQNLIGQQYANQGQGLQSGAGDLLSLLMQNQQGAGPSYGGYAASGYNPTYFGLPPVSTGRLS